MVIPIDSIMTRGKTISYYVSIKERESNRSNCTAKILNVTVHVLYHALSNENR